MKNKSILSIILIMSLVFLLCACGNTSTTDNIGSEAGSSGSKSGQIIELSEIGIGEMEDHLLMECNYVEMESGGFKFKLVTAAIDGTFQDASTVTIAVALNRSVDDSVITWYLEGTYDNVTMNKESNRYTVLIDLDLPENGETETYFVVKGYAWSKSISSDDAINSVYLYQRVEEGTFTYN